MKEGNIDNLLETVDNLLLEGYSPEQIINQFYDQVIGSAYMSELKKARILEKIGECDQALNEGGKDEVQLKNMFSSSLYILSKPDFI